MYIQIKDKSGNAAEMQVKDDKLNIKVSDSCNSISIILGAEDVKQLSKAFKKYEEILSKKD